MPRIPVAGEFKAMVECPYCNGTGLIEYYNSNAVAHGYCKKCGGEGGYLHVFKYKPFSGKKVISDNQLLRMRLAPIT